MPRAYADAVQLVEKEARRRRAAFMSNSETCSIFNACDRAISESIYSPISTPEFDTSAMDGFALSSVATHDASSGSPVTFEVKGTTTAGDEPHSTLDDPRDGVPPCVEIMTGAPFPVGEDGDQFDCCVPVEEVTLVQNKLSNRRYMTLSKPAQWRQHRRVAGGDFGQNDRIIEVGERINAQHIMAMASVGLTKIPVMRKPRVAIFSTGCELLSSQETSHRFMIHDANGPYLTTILTKYGADVDFRGIVHDNPTAMENALLEALDEEKYDIILTSGAVSAGRCDMVPGVIDSIGGRKVFHKVAVKPGHPLLFSVLQEETAAFFGLPGNPVAAAACLRFFVLPYLRSLQSQPPEQPHPARLQVPKSTRPVLSFRKDADIFRPAILSPCGQFVQIIEDHSPGKTKPFMHANCWVHIPSGVDQICDGAAVEIYPRDFV
ncbi:MoeA, N-terminal and linker domain-containing protein [Aspergillus pseudoustus]|uniref:molybdopterin adenylyltransferase n=1 Tax=Aspergillus pseudoustus TaxID=1810923 RepID=A0ABR4JBA8_9EURO